MRICLLGEVEANLDEAMRKTSFELYNKLSEYEDVKIIDLRDYTKISFWKSILNGNFDIIHYLHGSTIKSFVLLKLIKLVSLKSKTVMSVVHPKFSHKSFFKLLPIKPDLTLVSSKKMEVLFENVGFNPEFFIANGVDENRFSEVIKSKKYELRKKNGFDINKIIILHVGSLKYGRDIETLINIQSSNKQVVIISPVSTGFDQKLFDDLKKNNCIIIREYIDNIEIYYQMSDFYIFPVSPQKDTVDCIDVPLSVLEAMSCNLPVITTRFGSLTLIFKESESLKFINHKSEIMRSLKQLKVNNNNNNREVVTFYSWGNISRRLLDLYSKILKENV